MIGGGLSLEPAPQPFLKWAGGKRQLLREIEERLPPGIRTGEIDRYIEPMIGGGALFFHLIQRYPIREVYLSDYNWDLYIAYRVISSRLPALLRELQTLADEYLPLTHEERTPMFYRVRDEYNEERDELMFTKKGTPRKRMCEAWVRRTAQTIFLNRTCFNGLYRVNSKGNFNVPHGRYDNPSIRDERNLRVVSRSLKGVTIDCGSYETCERHVNSRTFVYFDPPYRPLSETSSFVAYSKGDFNDEDQRELAGFFRMLDERGAQLLLSNSDPKNTVPEDDFFDDLYRGFNIQRVEAIRAINSNPDRRGAVTELMIRNYE